MDEGEELLGVVQLINHRDDRPFSAEAVEGLQALCQTLAVLSASEFDLAQHTARSKSIALEHVLIKDFQVELSAIGAALAKFFGVPYESFRPERLKPVELLRNLKRDYIEASQWLPVEESEEGIVIIATDPERLRSTRVVQNVFPRRRLAYKVTTQTEFGQSVDWFFGALAGVEVMDDLLSDLAREDGEGSEALGDEAVADNNWCAWLTRSSSMPTSKGRPTSTSGRGPVRKRRWCAFARMAPWCPTSRFPQPIAALWWCG